jgi:hypothetical protein
MAALKLRRHRNSAAFVFPTKNLCQLLAIDIIHQATFGMASLVSGRTPVVAQALSVGREERKPFYCLIH